MDNSKNSFDLIKKSRELYFDKGSLRRYCLRDEIANSWIKFNLLKNHDLELTNNFSEKGSKLKFISRSVTDTLKKYNYKIYILLDNNHIYDFSFKKTREYYATGAEIAFKLKKDFTVFKQEHISDKFDDSFTHGFFIKEEGSTEYILGIYGNYCDYSETKINEVKRIIHNKFVERNNKNSTLNFIDCENKYKEIVHHYLPIVLIGESGTGRNYFVQYLLKKKSPKSKLKIINCKDVEDIKDHLKVKSKTLLYLKNIQWLSYKNQIKLATFIDSKLVNSNRDKTSIDNTLTVIASTTKAVIEEENKGWIDGRLLTRLTANKLYFRPVNKFNDKRIFKIIEVETNRKLKEETKDILTEFSWENNWNDVKKLIDHINENSSGLEIDVYDIPKFLLQRKPKITTIKEAEEKLIRRSLKVFDENITLTSKALGVSRSTLYRKMKEYDIRD